MTAPWLHSFAEPPAKSRPIPFWSWNEKMEPDEIRRQIQAIKAGGWGGAFLHARQGLRTPYLGEEWFAACGVAVEACRDLGLQVWLYDEEGWPSGISGGSVPLAEAEFRMKALFARPVGQVPPPGSVPLGEPQYGLQVYAWTSPLGSWRFNGACFADLLSRPAMARFLDDAYASYHRRFAADYGTTIAAEFLDEPSAMVPVLVPGGALPWTTGLGEAFARQHGYDLTSRLPHLFTDHADSVRLRIHFARTVSQLFEDNFTRQLGVWCTAHGIALTGHFMEGGLYSQQAGGNRVMPNYRHLAIPGIDHLCWQVSEIITAKQCHAVVNQYAKPQMLCEAFGAAGQHLTFADRWWMAMHLVSLGVTRFVPHLALYSMTGCRKRDFPPNLFHQQPWWPVNTVIDTALARLGVAMSQGRPRSEVLVLHPQETAAALFRPRTDWAEPAALVTCVDVTSEAIKAFIGEIDRDFQEVVSTLLGAQRLLDLGDEEILAETGTVASAAGTPLLCVGAMAYPVVMLPSMLTLAPSTLRLLTEFHAAGGIILCAGEVPTLVDGEPSPALTRLLSGCPQVAPAAAPQALAQVLPPLVRLSSDQGLDQVFIQVRDLGDGDRLVFLADRRRSGPPLAAVLAAVGSFSAVHRLDPLSGRETAMAGDPAALPLEFHPASGLLLRLSRQPHAIQPPAPASRRIVLPLPPEAWTVERCDDNALTLDTVLWREGPDEAFTTVPIPVVAVQGRLDELRYHGPLTLRYPFATAGLSPGRPVHLVIEYPERYRIVVNGTEVAYAGLPPYRDHHFKPIDISGLVRAGTNLVELHLATFHWAENDAPRERQADRTGTEIEAVYLVGDFQVRAERIQDGPDPVTTVVPFSSGPQDVPPIHLHYLASASLALSDPATLAWGDVTSQGLPFYAGRLRLVTTLREPLGPGAWELALADHDAAVATVEADGVAVGALFARPLTVALPAGTRTIALTLFSSLRNLLGPHHHEAGEPVNLAPWFFLPYCGHGAERASNTRAWGEGRFHPANHRDSYACVGFGRVDGLRLQGEAPTGA